MKILLINHYAGGPRYGMEFRPLYLAREWVKLGYQVTIVAADQSHVRYRNPNLQTNVYEDIDGLSSKFRQEEVNGVRFIWCKTPTYEGNGIGRVFNILTFLLRLLQLSTWLKRNFRPDQIITSSTYPMDIFPARWIQWLCRPSQIIYEVHDLWPLSPIELGGMSKWHPFILWVQLAEDLSYKWADKIVSMLPKTKDYMVSRGMNSEKFNYIPNAIDFDEWDETINGDRNRDYESKVNEIKSRFDVTIAYFGTHGLANALTFFIDAAELSANQSLSVAYLLVGSGPEKENLIKRVKEKNLTNVFFMEPVTKTEIPAALKMIDILYIGLQNQSLFRFGISPNKLIDYMAAAKPILFAIESGNNPVLEANCGYAVKAENTEAIVEGLKKFQVLSIAEREQMGKNGLAFVRANHDYKVLADKFVRSVFKG